MLIDVEEVIVAEALTLNLNGATESGPEKTNTGFTSGSGHGVDCN